MESRFISGALERKEKRSYSAWKALFSRCEQFLMMMMMMMGCAELPSSPTRAETAVWFQKIQPAIEMCIEKDHQERLEQTQATGSTRKRKGCCRPNQLKVCTVARFSRKVTASDLEGLVVAQGQRKKSAPAERAKGKSLKHLWKQQQSLRFSVTFCFE